MAEVYERAVLEIVELQGGDIITTSGIAVVLEENEMELAIEVDD